MRIVLITLSICTLLSGCSFNGSSLLVHKLFAADASKDAATLSAEAYDLIARADYQGAIAKAELAVRKDPTLGDAQKNLALAYCDAGRVNDALTPAQRAVALVPKLDKAHYVLGKVLFKLKRLDEAIPEFQKAISLNPEYDKAFFLLGRSYDLSNKPGDAQVALDRAVQLKPDYSAYRLVRDYVVAYARELKSQTRIPTVSPIAGQPKEYATAVYSGIFHEALIHQNFELLERAADAARSSKEKLPGGIWMLQQIYSGLNRPLEVTSDFEWNEQLVLLQQWTEAKPNSPTAKAALASGYVAFAWYARGDGPGNTVTQQNWQLFNDRLEKARVVLESHPSKPLCPKWFSTMQQVALGQGWDKQRHERLFEDAIQFEPTWYEYYKQKAIFLLPQWYGEPGELKTFVESISVRPEATDNAMVYFLVNEFADAVDSQHKNRPASSYSVLRQGFMDLRRLYGVTSHNVNYACFKAVLSNDRAFAQELFQELKDNADLDVWSNKQTFDGARAFAETR